MTEPVQKAWCFVCGVEIRRSTMPPAIWVHNDMDGLRDHDALPDIDEAVREAVAAYIDESTDRVFNAGVKEARKAVADMRAKARQPRYDIGLEAALVAIDEIINESHGRTT